MSGKSRLLRLFLLGHFWGSGFMGWKARWKSPFGRKIRMSSTLELQHRRHELRKEIKADIMCVWSSINNLRHTQARTKTVLKWERSNLQHFSLGWKFKMALVYRFWLQLWFGLDGNDCHCSCSAMWTELVAKLFGVSRLLPMALSQNTMYKWDSRKGTGHILD